MSRLTTIALLLSAYVAVFLQCHAMAWRRLTGSQLDFLTPLMVYAGVMGGPSTIAWLALLGGLWLDGLSANPLGVSVLPLFTAGFVIQRHREYVLGDQVQAQWIVGAATCAVTPLLTLFLLAGMEHRPLLNGGLLWDWLQVTLGGAVLTPFVFWMFNRFNAAVHHPVVGEDTFRKDREIKRGRH